MSQQVLKEILAHEIASSERSSNAHERLLLLEDHIKEEVRSEMDQLQEHLDKKFAAVHRNIHSGDKISKILIALVDKINELQDMYVWKCPECGAECIWDAGDAGDGGTPMCTISQAEGDDEDEDDNGDGCDIDMVPDRFALFDTDEWKDAESIVIRIKRAKENK